jgi:2-polyprenyl-3-methyl-5-hydroxy-6-metoxy-1,4-benzoquinol methylase
MSKSLQNIYESHHSKAREAGFSVMKSERGELFSSLIGTGKEILDLGCRDGALTSYFVKGNRVTGVDIDQLSLKRAEESLGIKTMYFDIQSEWDQIGNKKYDVVVAGEFLEHVYYPDKVIEKVSRVLNPDGIFVGSVPNAFTLKNRLKYLFAIKKYTPLSDPTHINHFGAKEFEALLKKNFKNVKIYGIGRLGILAKIYPQWFAFDICFLAKDKK